MKKISTRAEIEVPWATELVLKVPMVRRGAMGIFVLAAALVCSGCGPAVEPIEVASGCPGRPLRGPADYATNEPADQLIDNFESGNDTNLPIPPIEGRDGYWVLGQDFVTAVLIDEVSSHCAARGTWAGHFEARGSKSWGNNWTAVFRASTSASGAVPYDGSQYTKISFWAAFGAENGPDFEVPMGLTTMDNAWNSGGCTACMDFYATKVPLSHDWQPFVLPFDQMAQSGTGDPLVPMRRDQLVGFIIWPRQQFDIWIDDVRFER